MAQSKAGNPRGSGIAQKRTSMSQEDSERSANRSLAESTYGQKGPNGNAKRSHAERLGVSEQEAAPWGNGAYANMPQEIRMEIYAKGHKSHGNVLDDTITHVDDTNLRGDDQAQKYISNQH